MEALTEKPNAEPLPRSSGAAIIQDGHYLPRPSDKDGKLWARTTVLIQRSPQELYELWRDVRNAPAWQEQITEVVPTGERTSRWTMKVKDTTLTWNAEVLADEPGKRIAWRSVDGDVNEAGEVVFEKAPGDRGTFVIVLMEFRMGKLAAAWKSLTDRSPRQQVVENLRHFKALAETGEIPNSASASHADRGWIGGVKRSLYGENVPTPTGNLAS